MGAFDPDALDPQVNHSTSATSGLAGVAPVSSVRFVSRHLTMNTPRRSSVIESGVPSPLFEKARN